MTLLEEVFNYRVHFFLYNFTICMEHILLYAFFLVAYLMVALKLIINFGQVPHPSLGSKA